MKQIGIYKITSPSGSIYIGQSNDIKRRWTEYKNNTKSCRSQTRLANSFNKYGVCLHSFEVVELCDANILNEREIFWIKELKTFNSIKGLNLRNGGSRGEMSAETKKLISKNHSRYNLGKKASLETREKIRQARLKQSDPNLGKKRSKEIREAFSKQRKGKKLSVEHCKKISEGLRNSQKRKEKMASSEYRQKLSEAKMGHGVTSQARAKMAQSWNYDKHFTAETKEKIRLGNLRRWEKYRQIKKYESN